MTFEKVPQGTRGAKTPPGWVGRFVMPVMVRFHRRSGDRFNGMDLLYLTTIGARSGQRRTTPVARFDDGAGGWYVVASARGAAAHPAWYHNIAAHPDQVWAEVGRTTCSVRVEQVTGAEREQTWARIVERAPNFGGYVTKTDREIPVLHLTPLSAGA